MRILMVSCSRQAYSQMKKLEEIWRRERPETEIVTGIKCKSLPELSMKESLAEYIGHNFDRMDLIIFFCASGIAVRCIAPCIGHKSKDPAVLVIDGRGKFCISLLAGHAGGGNEWAEWTAGKIGAVPVITTATDLEGRFAVDDFARKNQLVLTDWKRAKEISARILEGERIGLWSQFPVEGEIPEELFLTKERQKAKIWISYQKFEDQKYEKSDSALQLVPRCIAVGIGCRKGTQKSGIAAAIENCLQSERIHREAVFMAASIDLKKEEEGIRLYCEENGLSFLTFSREALEKIPGDFSGSDFVKEITGVDNVCERSALAAARGKLICKKKISGGVTAALAVRKGSVRF